MTNNVLAFDYGASSGRAIVGSFDGKGITTTEVHRFLNEPVSLNGGFYWDILRLFEEMKRGIKKAVADFKIESIAIDTWGVDVGFIDKNGELMGNPYHYRHPHTENAVEGLLKVMDADSLYKSTGLANLKFNTLCQLNEMIKNGYFALENADAMLFIPDLMMYFLTGKRVTEYSIASTSQLLVPAKSEWNYEIIDKFGIDKKLLQKIVNPSETVGLLKQELKDELGIDYDIKVIACAGHDTASAVMAVPATDEDFAYISSGTWSLLGCELKKPVLTEKARLSGYTNEGGFDNSVRFLKNIMGLWILQECKRSWDGEGNCMKFDEIDEHAYKSEPFKCLINPDHDDFFSPKKMPQKIYNFCKSTGQRPPENIGETARTIAESLAFIYKKSLGDLEDILGKKFSALNIVGGGSNNKMLNQFTANAIGIPVIAGPSEATSIGNIVCQFIGLGLIDNIWDARKIVKESFKCKTYYPENTAEWQSHYTDFLKLL